MERLHGFCSCSSFLPATDPPSSHMITAFASSMRIYWGNQFYQKAPAAEWCTWGWGGNRSSASKRSRETTADGFMWPISTVLLSSLFLIFEPAQITTDLWVYTHVCARMRALHYMLRAYCTRSEHAFFIQIKTIRNLHYWRWFEYFDVQNSTESMAREHSYMRMGYIFYFPHFLWQRSKLYATFNWSLVNEITFWLWMMWQENDIWMWPMEMSPIPNAR